MNKKKLILIILIALIVLAGLVWLFFYVTEPLPILVKFKEGVSEQEAIAIIDKYEKGISQREHMEYDNPFFSLAYPYSKTHVIEFEVGRINAELTARRIREENAVETVRVFSRSYEKARPYKVLYESLNPALNEQ